VIYQSPVDIRNSLAILHLLQHYTKPTPRLFRKQIIPDLIVNMQFSTLTSALLLPLIAYAQATSTLTATQTKTITISEVVATTTATYNSGNATIVFATGTGASSGIVSASTAIISPISSATGSTVYATGAASLNAVNIGSAVGAALAIVALF